MRGTPKQAARTLLVRGQSETTAFSIPPPERSIPNRPACHSQNQVQLIKFEYHYRKPQLPSLGISSAIILYLRVFSRKPCKSSNLQIRSCNRSISMSFAFGKAPTGRQARKLTGKMAGKIALFCDGTWCGEAAGTRTNIKILAQCFANTADLASGQPYTRDDGLVVVYFDGLGLAGNFSDYLTNGTAATDLSTACIDTYAAIVEHFRSPKEGPSEVWLFGLSRGAYTVRSVCGMIHNWGILSRAKILAAAGKDPAAKDSFTRRLCATVYAQLRSPDEVYKPKNEFARKFKQAYCYDLEKAPPPVKFMGLLDTVGALGIPLINSGVGLSYEFYDQIVSTDVQNVYQALATHDRLGLFTPCFARRNESKMRQLHIDGPVKYVTEEAWFPGAHYDIGRQRFVFPRKAGRLERVLNFLDDHYNFLGINVRPTDAFSDAPLKWMLDNVATHDVDMVPGNACEKFGSSVTQAGGDRVKSFLWVLLSVVWRIVGFGRTPKWMPCSPELSINAYDTLVTRLLPSWLNPFAGLALQDRQVPLYRDATFRGMNLPLVETHKSQTYHAWLEQAPPLQAALNGTL